MRSTVRYSFRSYGFWIVFGLGLTLVLSACGGDGGGGPGGETGGDTGGETPVGEVNLRIDVAGEVSWAAFQDGDGDWRSVEPGETAELNVTDAAGRFGLVSVCEGEGGDTSVNVFYATLESYEQAPGFPSSLTCSEAIPSPPPDLTLSGAVTGIETGEGGNVSFGLANDVFYNDSGEPKLSYILDTVVAGSADLVATNGPVRSSAPDGPPTRAIVQRGEQVSADATRDLDFAAQGFDLEQRTVEVTNLNPLDAGYTGTVTLLSEGGTEHPALANTDPEDVLDGETSLSFAYAGLPANEGRSGDRYRANIELRPAGDETGCTRISTRVTATPEDITIDPPACFEVDVVVIDTEPYVRPDATLRDSVDVTAATSSSYTYGQLESLISTSAAFFGNERAREATAYQVPDFSSVDGWDNAWGLTTAGEIRYAATFEFADDPAADGPTEGDSVEVRGTVFF